MSYRFEDAKKAALHYYFTYGVRLYLQGEDDSSQDGLEQEPNPESIRQIRAFSSDEVEELEHKVRMAEEAYHGTLGARQRTLPRLIPGTARIITVSSREAIKSVRLTKPDILLVGKFRGERKACEEHLKKLASSVNADPANISMHFSQNEATYYADSRVIYPPHSPGLPLWLREVTGVRYQARIVTDQDSTLEPVALLAVKADPDKLPILKTVQPRKPRNDKLHLTPVSPEIPHLCIRADQINPAAETKASLFKDEMDDPLNRIGTDIRAEMGLRYRLASSRPVSEHVSLEAVPRSLLEALSELNGDASGNDSGRFCVITGYLALTLWMELVGLAHLLPQNRLPLLTLWGDDEMLRPELAQRGMAERELACLDIEWQLPGVSDELLFERATIVQIEGLTLRILHPLDLLANTLHTFGDSGDYGREEALEMLHYLNDVFQVLMQARRLREDAQRQLLQKLTGWANTPIARRLQRQLGFSVVRLPEPL